MISGYIFSITLLQLQEKGMIDQALKEFKGANPTHVESETLILSAGQTLLVFLLIGTGAIVSMLTFGFEIVLCKWNVLKDGFKKDHELKTSKLERNFMSTAEVENRLFHMKMKKWQDS